jgi:predicted TIM-barrel fold metal-dependent hydrolase
VHAHFYQEGCGRPDWRQLNENRLAFGDRIGITWHVASVLGSWGRYSPTYFQSPTDTVAGNEAMLQLAAAASSRVRAYVAVNPNDTDVAIRCLTDGAKRGAVGLKLAAARRADDMQLNAVIECAATYHFPVLHHIWQHRRRHWPGQDISDGTDLCRLAARHPCVSFILAHIGGGGDYAHTFAAVRETPNVYLDLSGSGVDRGMLDGALAAVGAARLLWGADLTLCTGLAKLRALEVIGLSATDLAAIRWTNAARIFPAHAFPGLRKEAHTR